MSSFPDPSQLSGTEFILPLAGYGFVIFWASKFIRDGAAIIGSPVLCAIPTSLLVMSSGLSQDAQQTVVAGLGVLAGSNVMLLCVSWFLCVLSGRSTGVELSDEVKAVAYHVFGTSVMYLFIQVPAIFMRGDFLRLAAWENAYAQWGVCICFFLLVVHLVVRHKQAKARGAAEPSAARLLDEPSGGEAGDGINEEDPEDLAISCATLMKSLCMIGVSTFVLLVFADPAEATLVAMSADLGVSPFYVSFVLAPLATNGSELLAACSYGRKKTRGSVTACLAHLEGAAVGNNTIGLGVFFFIIFMRNLVWQFTAETISIMMVQALWFIYVMVKKVQTVTDACCLLCLYPLSLGAVYVLEAYLQLD